MGGINLVDGFHRIEVKIPQKLHFQLVFRQERVQPFSPHPVDSSAFNLINGLPGWARSFPELLNFLGLKQYLRCGVKILMGRVFYFVKMDAKVVHTGWITLSWCRYYRVERGDVVIGPLWSATSIRGKGIGAYGTQMAINAMVLRGHSVFFIDTSDTNTPCLRMIEKCGFESPVSCYLRD